jgi:hypothetical protein
VYVKKLISIWTKIAGIRSAKVEKVHATEDEKPNNMEKKANFQ